jgi:hypothetical protein
MHPIFMMGLKIGLINCSFIERNNFVGKFLGLRRGMGVPDIFGSLSDFI